MIRTHEFNSQWLGQPFGVSHDPALLTCQPDELRSLARGYQAIELRCDAQDVPTSELLPTNGLVHVDIQIGYVLSLAGIAAVPDGLRVRQFSELSMDARGVLDLAPFGAERYRRLSFVDDDLVAKRYAEWSRQLVVEHPEWALLVEAEGRSIGYAFGRFDGNRRLDLDLVAASTGSFLPGLALFKAALATYRKLGVRTVQASFSAHNVAAMNAHIALGCRISSSTDIWFYEPEQPR